MDKSNDTRNRLLISLFLMIAIICVFQQVKDFKLIGFDDDLYVGTNSRVQAGLTFKGMIWAFSDFSTANWHPVTWLSHMLDCEIYGLNPMGHHWTNLQLHIANTLLLFFLLLHMTQALWRSALVAALFALHPLHVESVAWVAERKDVLSTFLGLLAMGSYLRYIEYPRIINYLLMMFLFSLGLMAKPMLVTLPFVLLLLDFWPLRRFHDKFLQPNFITSRHFMQLVREKIPLFVLVAAASILTIVAQQSQGAVGSLKAFPIHVRISNALVSYAGYVCKTIWPRNLAVYYPHPGDTLPLWQPVGAVFLIAGACFLAIRKSRQYPYIAVGLFWYLGTLLPVIGIVQVGGQAMADRYTYIPLIGLFIIIVWGAADLFGKRRFNRVGLRVSAVIVILLLSICTFQQLKHWENNVKLFEAAINVTDDNYVAYNNLGTAYGKKDFEKAIFYLKKAIKIKPDYFRAYYNLGTLLGDNGRFEEAVLYLTKALTFNPKDARARKNLAHVFFVQGELEKAASLYSELLKINTEDADAHSHLANVLMTQHRSDEAFFHYRQALRINPDHKDAHYNLGTLFAEQKKINQAVFHFSEAIKIDPDYFKAYNYIGVILAQMGKPQQAGRFFSKAIQIRPSYVAARKNLEILKKAWSGHE